jgi:hypothetical protein
MEVKVRITLDKFGEILKQLAKWKVACVGIV